MADFSYSNNVTDINVTDTEVIISITIVIFKPPTHFSIVDKLIIPKSKL